MSDQDEVKFSSRFEIQVLQRAEGSDAGSWQELDRGPGYFHIPPGFEAGVRIRQSDDATLEEIFAELRSCTNLTHLNLSENRKVTDDGLKGLTLFPRMRELNLSSCDITDEIFPTLRKMAELRRLSLSFCPRISDLGIRTLVELRKLTFLDLQGCPRITRAGLARVERVGLTIHKHK